MFRLRVRHIKLSRQKRRNNHSAIRQNRPQRGVIMRDFGAHSEVRLMAIQSQPSDRRQAAASLRGTSPETPYLCALKSARKGAMP